MSLITHGAGDRPGPGAACWTSRVYGQRWSPPALHMVPLVDCDDKMQKWRWGSLSWEAKDKGLDAAASLKTGLAKGTSLMAKAREACDSGTGGRGRRRHMHGSSLERWASQHPERHYCRRYIIPDGWGQQEKRATQELAREGVMSKDLHFKAGGTLSKPTSRASLLCWLSCLPGVDKWIPDMQKQSERNLEVQIVQIMKGGSGLKSPIAKCCCEIIFAGLYD